MASTEDSGVFRSTFRKIFGLGPKKSKDEKRRIKQQKKEDKKSKNPPAVVASTAGPTSGSNLKQREKHEEDSFDWEKIETNTEKHDYRNSPYPVENERQVQRNSASKWGDVGRRSTTAASMVNSSQGNAYSEEKSYYQYDKFHFDEDTDDDADGRIGKNNTNLSVKQDLHSRNTIATVPSSQSKKPSDSYYDRLAVAYGGLSYAPGIPSVGHEQNVWDKGRDRSDSFGELFEDRKPVVRTPTVRVDKQNATTAPYYEHNRVQNVNAYRSDNVTSYSKPTSLSGNRERSDTFDNLFNDLTGPKNETQLNPGQNGNAYRSDNVSNNSKPISLSGNRERSDTFDNLFNDLTGSKNESQLNPEPIEHAAKSIHPKGIDTYSENNVYNTNSSNANAVQAHTEIQTNNSVEHKKYSVSLSDIDDVDKTIVNKITSLEDELAQLKSMIKVRSSTPGRRSVKKKPQQSSSESSSAERLYYERNRSKKINQNSAQASKRIETGSRKDSFEDLFNSDNEDAEIGGEIGSGPKNRQKYDELFKYKRESRFREKDSELNNLSSSSEASETYYRVKRKKAVNTKKIKRNRKTKHSNIKKLPLAHEFSFSSGENESLKRYVPVTNNILKTNGKKSKDFTSSSSEDDEGIETSWNSTNEEKKMQPIPKNELDENEMTQKKTVLMEEEELPSLSSKGKNKIHEKSTEKVSFADDQHKKMLKEKEINVLNVKNERKQKDAIDQLFSDDDEILFGKRSVSMRDLYGQEKSEEENEDTNALTKDLLGSKSKNATQKIEKQKAISTLNDNTTERSILLTDSNFENQEENFENIKSDDPGRNSVDNIGLNIAEKPHKTKSSLGKHTVASIKTEEDKGEDEFVPNLSKIRRQRNGKKTFTMVETAPGKDNLTKNDHTNMDDEVDHVKSVKVSSRNNNKKEKINAQEDKYRMKEKDATEVDEVGSHQLMPMSRTSRNNVSIKNESVINGTSSFDDYIDDEPRDLTASILSGESESTLHDREKVDLLMRTNSSVKSKESVSDNKKNRISKEQDDTIDSLFDTTDENDYGSLFANPLTNDDSIQELKKASVIPSSMQATEIVTMTSNKADTKENVPDAKATPSIEEANAYTSKSQNIELITFGRANKNISHASGATNDEDLIGESMVDDENAVNWERLRDEERDMKQKRLLAKQQLQKQKQHKRITTKDNSRKKSKTINENEIEIEKKTKKSKRKKEKKRISGTSKETEVSKEPELKPLGNNQHHHHHHTKTVDRKEIVPDVATNRDFAKKLDNLLGGSTRTVVPATKVEGNRGSEELNHIALARPIQRKKRPTRPLKK